MKAIGWLLVSCLAAGCSRDAADADGTAHVVKPATPEPPVSTPGSSASPERMPDGVEPPPPAGERPAAAQRTATKAESAKSAAAKAAPSTPETERSPASTPSVTKPTSTAKPRAHKTVIPRTDHVRVEVGAGLQKLLDHDTRMQPWLQRVMRVANNCYAELRKAQPGAAGVIRIRITMHDTARPTPDIQSLPSALSGVVACATGALARTSMPLFTGPEGEKHSFAIHFTP